MAEIPCYSYETETNAVPSIKVEAGFLVDFVKYEKTKVFSTGRDMSNYLLAQEQRKAEKKEAQKLLREQQKKKKKEQPEKVYTYHSLTKRAKLKIMSKTELFLWVTGAKRMSNKKKIYYDKNNVTFATLTLPFKQIHEDTEIKAICLNQFLTEIRKKYNIRYYLWKAEKTKAGALHFHILFDRFIHYGYLNKTWNRNINKLGYVDQYQKKFSSMTWETYYKYWCQTKYKDDKRSYKKVFEAYQKGVRENWKNPNSTDIHKLKQVKSLSKYVGKYLGEAKAEISAEMSKEVQCDKINGKIWFLSTALSSLKNTSVHLKGKIQKEYSYLCTKFADRIKNHDFASVLLVNLDTLIENKCFNLVNVYINNSKAPPVCNNS
jgi:hypothetical protein